MWYVTNPMVNIVYNVRLKLVLVINVKTVVYKCIKASILKVG